MSRISGNNSTTALLGAGQTFTGQWDNSPDEHMAYNIITDVPGTVYVDFGILKASENPVDGIAANGVDVTFTGSQPVYGSQGRFRSLVKLSNRAFRIRYVNGATPQTQFNLLAETGNNLFPSSSSADGEIITTVTERERNTFAVIAKTGVSASGFVILADLSAQDRTGRIDITATYISIDRDANATGRIRVGVITRVDGTNADVTYVQGINFSNSDDRTIIRDRNFSPSQIKLGVTGGVATRVSGQVVTNISGINTATPLESPSGAATVTPAVGDIVVAYERSAGSYNVSVSAFLHGEDEA